MPRPAAVPPSMEALLSSGEGVALAREFGRGRAKDALRLASDRLRRGELDGLSALHEDARRQLAGLRPRIRTVVNATGVMLHTNLGRAPLADEARAAVQAAAGYCTVEYDLESGGRGRRSDHVRSLLLAVFAPGRAGLGALAVTNNAAALLLALDTLANGRPVAVSRGELVAIGGDFRVPSILARSGASLMEVGTTNKTTPADYEEALREGAGLVLKVHPSNYRIVGYTEEVPLQVLAPLAAAHAVPVVYDAGSGAPWDVPEGGVAPSPSPDQALDAGAALVCLSGDKTLGGPQAGIVLGREELVARCASNPLARALRPDKLALAALAATLELAASGREDEIPFVRMLRVPLPELARRAEALAEAARRAGLEAAVVESVATAGGGAGSDSALPSRAVRLTSPRSSADQLAASLRAGQVAIVSRVAEGAVLLDLRTIDPGDDGAVAAALEALRP